MRSTARQAERYPNTIGAHNTIGACAIQWRWYIDAIKGN